MQLQNYTKFLPLFYADAVKLLNLVIFKMHFFFSKWILTRFFSPLRPIDYYCLSIYKTTSSKMHIFEKLFTDL